jgi:hypothetical protein
VANVLNWFEIPVTDMDRAERFYAAVLGAPLTRMPMGPLLMAFFPMEGDGVGGALVQGPGCVPSPHGTQVYLNGGDDLSPFLARVEPAGGRVVIPRTLVRDDIGYFALFEDTEGNRVAFHSLR